MRKTALFTGKNYWQQDIKKREYLLAAGQGGGIILVICLLFYRSLALGVVLVLPLDLLYLAVWRRQYSKKKQSDFSLQFQDAIEALAVALRTGYSMENAIRETLRDMRVMYKEDTRIISELVHMSRQIQMNIPAEQVWREFSNRIQHEDVQNFTEVFVISKRSGGDVIAVMQNTVNQIRDKAEVKREIATIIAEKRLELRVMSAMPLGIIAYMSLSFPDFMSSLYGNAAGAVIMSICLAFYAVSYQLGKKIIEIEV